MTGFDWLDQTASQSRLLVFLRRAYIFNVNRLMIYIYVLVVFDPIDDSVRKRKEAVPSVIWGNIFDLLYRKSSSHDLPLALSSSMKKYQEQLALCERITAEIQKRDSDVLGAVKTIKGLVTLPANTETSITCMTCKNIDDYTELIEPADDATLPQGLMLHPTNDIVKQGKVTCRLMDFSDVDIILHKPLKVGNICTCKIVTPDLDITLDEEGEAVIDYHKPDPVLGQRGWHNLPFSVEMGDICTNKSENRELCNLFHRYSNISSRDTNYLCFTDKVVHHIKTTDDVPVRQRDRRIPWQAVSEVRNMLTD